MNIPESALRWICGSDTGISSRTLFAALTGQIAPGSQMNWREHGIPHDFDDFGRCYRLIEHVPEWAPRLNEVAVAFPAWIPVIREWDKLAELYRNGRPYGHQELWGPIEDESRHLDGYIQDSPNAWHRPSKGD